ncbi:MAG: response regulator transcription factor [Dehalococcoidia bacterium]
MTGQKILVVEDDPGLLEALRYSLAAEGYEVSAVSDGGDGLRAARDQAPDLVILDLMLPTLGGLDVCRSLRLAGSITPILMLTARDSEVDRVVGLEVGADDYVTKPFSMRELLARVAAMLRRVDMQRREAAAEAPEVLEFDGLVVDVARRAVTLDGEPVQLRRKEFDLLAYLASSPNRPFSREMILQNVWGYEYAGDTRTVDVHIRWLRMKIERDPSDPKRLLTMRGVGYRFQS